MKRLLFALLVAAFCLTSCINSKEILFSGYMFGTMSGSGIMLGDDGNTYHFGNGQITADMPVTGRIYAAFQAYKLMDGTRSDYEADLLEYVIPLTNDPIVCTTPEEVEALGKAPVGVASDYYGGGYLNMACVALISDNSSAHVINLQIIPAENTDTLHTVLRHYDGQNESSSSLLDSYTRYPFYASFPLKNHLDEEKTKVIEVKYLWDQEWLCSYIGLKK